MDEALLQTTKQEGYWAALRGCALHRMTRDYLRVLGPERTTYLQGMVTNDVASLELGASVAAAVVTAKGALIAVARVANLGDSMLLALDRGRGEATVAHLTRHLVSEEAEIESASELRSLALLGPAAAVHAEPLQSYTVARWNTPLGGIEVVYSVESEDAVTSALAGLPCLDEATVEILRVEQGVPLFGAELNDTTIPLECGLASAIAYDKGCYVGQEIIARATHRGGVRRKLRGFVMASVPSTRGVMLDGKNVGTLTSIVKSPRLPEVALALGFILRENAVAGTVTVTEEATEATVSDLPFVLPRP